MCKKNRKWKRMLRWHIRLSVRRVHSENCLGKVEIPCAGFPLGQLFVFEQTFHASLLGQFAGTGDFPGAGFPQGQSCIVGAVGFSMYRVP